MLIIFHQKPHKWMIYFTLSVTESQMLGHFIKVGTEEKRRLLLQKTNIGLQLQSLQNYTHTGENQATFFQTIMSSCKQICSYCGGSPYQIDLSMLYIVTCLYLCQRRFSRTGGLSLTGTSRHSNKLRHCNQTSLYLFASTRLPQ